MTPKRTNWHTFILGLVAAILAAVALAITAGQVPIPKEAAWLAPIAVAAITYATPKLREMADEPPPQTFADLPYKVPPRTWINSRAPWPAPDGTSPQAPSAPLELASSRQPPGPLPPGAGVTP